MTNRGSISDWSGNGAGFFYPRGSGIPIGKLAGLILGGTVEGDVRVALPWECCDFHPGPIEDGSAVPFEPRFKNYVIRRDGLLDFDWAHWPTDLGAPTDPNGAPLLLGDQTVWSLHNDAPAPWEPPPYSSRAPLGVEVRQTTWAMSIPGAAGDAAYQRFRILNSSSHEIRDLYAALYLDPVTYDLGDMSPIPTAGSWRRTRRTFSHTRTAASSRCPTQSESCC